jgi:hypothetical protein
VNMVVARAGVARGTFYVHFKDRAAFRLPASVAVSWPRRRCR